MFHKRADLHKHVVENEEEIDGLWCHNKYVKATSGLIKMDSLHLTTVLVYTCENNKITISPTFDNMRIFQVYREEMPHPLPWSQKWESQCRRGSHLHYKLWTPQRQPVYTRPARCCQKDTEEDCRTGEDILTVVTSTFKTTLHVVTHYATCLHSFDPGLVPPQILHPYKGPAHPKQGLPGVWPEFGSAKGWLQS